MGKLKEYAPLFTAGIFFFSVLAGFNMMLNAKIEPIKESQRNFDKMLNAKIDPIKENQGRFEKRLDRIEVKLDQALNHRIKAPSVK